MAYVIVRQKQGKAAEYYTGEFYGRSGWSENINEGRKYERQAGAKHWSTSLYSEFEGYEYWVQGDGREGNGTDEHYRKNEKGRWVLEGPYRYEKQTRSPESHEETMQLIGEGWDDAGWDGGKRVYTKKVLVKSEAGKRDK